MATNSAVNSPLSGTTGTGQFVGNTSPVIKGYNYAVDVGAADAYAVVFSPVISSLVADFKIDVLIDNDNTGASTLTVDSNPAKNIVNPDGSALGGGALLSGMIATFAYNGTEFQLMNSALAGATGATPSQVQTDAFNSGTEAGSTNAFVVDLSPVPVLNDGLRVSFIPSGANTSPVPTLDLNSNGATVIQLMNGGTLLAGDLDTNTLANVTWNSAIPAWLLENPRISMQTYYVALTDAGSADAYVVGLPSTVIAYTDNLTIVFNPANNCTGASTLDAGFGAKALVKQGQAALVLNDIVAGTNMIVVYSADNDNFQLINPQIAGSGTVTDVQVQSNAFNSGVDSGAADAYDIAVTPAITTPYPNMILCFNPANGSLSGSSTIALNGGTPLSVYSYNGTPNAAGDIAANVPCMCVADGAGTSWQLMNPLNAGLTPKYVTQGQYLFYPDAGVAADVYVATAGGVYAGQPSVAPFAGTQVIFLPANTNTGASTLNFNGGGAVAIEYNGLPLISGMMIANKISILEYDGTVWELINPAFSYSSQVYGTQTNDDAAAGFLGEEIEAVILQGAGVNLTTGTPTDIAVIAVGAGDWNVEGNVNFLGDTGTTTTLLQGWINTTSATFPNGAYTASQFFSTALALGANNLGFVVPSTQVKMSAPGNIYLSCTTAFAISTLEGSGKIWARRPR